MLQLHGARKGTYIVLIDLDVGILCNRVGVDSNLDRLSTGIEAWTLLESCWMHILLLISARAYNVPEIVAVHSEGGKGVG